MYKYKIIILLMGILMASEAFAQIKPENRVIKTISGTVINTDAVGNIISIRTNNQQLMSFFVPDKANITQQTHDIGLMDVQRADSVNIQYYLATSSRYFVVSIVDNESIVNE